jgi:hypothetical protein
MQDFSEKFIINLLRGKESPTSITGYIRNAFIQDKSLIEDLANNLHKMPGYDKNHHSKMRVSLARISDELGLERHSIRLVDGKYKLVIANRINSKNSSIRIEILRSAAKASDLPIEERGEILREIKRIFSL